jgi:predicted DNA-binding protein
MNKKSFRLTVNLSEDHRPSLEYLSNALGMSQSALAAQILDESLPEVFYMVQSAEKKIHEGSELKPKEIALVQALKTVTKFIEDS